jgi:hypothetical protein
VRNQFIDTIIKQIQCYIRCWKCPPSSAMHAFTLPQVWCNLVTSFFSDAWNSQLNILFHFFEHVQTVFMNILFQKSLYTQIQSVGSGDQKDHKFEETIWSPKNLYNIGAVEFAVCHNSILLKPAVLFISFQHGYEITRNGTDYSPSRHTISHFN